MKLYLSVSVLAIALSQQGIVRADSLNTTSPEVPLNQFAIRNYVL